MSMKNENGVARLSTGKALGGIALAIAILVVSQMLALSLSQLALGLGLPGAVCNVIAGILYVSFTLVGVGLLCRKFLRLPMAQLYIPKFRVKGLWLGTSVAMPALVVVLAVLAGGHWEVHTFDSATTWSIITGAVVFYGLATGIVEEVIFRGIIVGCLENRFGRLLAIMVPSVLFGALHIMGNSLGLLSTIQLLVAGTIVGVLFTLITWESGSVWNSAIVHGLWNAAIIGGILHIGIEGDGYTSMVNFHLGSEAFWLSGGDFGIEASIISIVVYFLFSLVAIYSMKKQKTPVQ